jgi:hypothetical protein
MAFTLEQVVPWGRSFDEYVAMFALSTSDLQKRILGCSDGPAGFNSVLTKRGSQVISIDPLYKFGKDELAKRIDETFEVVVQQTRANQQEFIWKHFASVEHLAETRREAMNTFLADYDQGCDDDRYLEASLPRLLFQNKTFDLALCSHFLFLYSELFSEEFHIKSIRELARVASEVRIFPLLELGSRKSRHLDSVLTTLAAEGFDFSVEQIDYEFQKGGNQMLRIHTIFKGLKEN